MIHGDGRCGQSDGREVSFRVWKLRPTKYGLPERVAAELAESAPWRDVSCFRNEIQALRRESRHQVLRHVPDMQTQHRSKDFGAATYLSWRARGKAEASLLDRHQF